MLLVGFIEILNLIYMCCFLESGWSRSVRWEGRSWIQTQRLQVSWGSGEKSTKHRPAGGRGDQHGTWHQHSTVQYLLLFEWAAPLPCSSILWFISLNKSNMSTQLTSFQTRRSTRCQEGDDSDNWRRVTRQSRSPTSHRGEWEGRNHTLCHRCESAKPILHPA